MAELATNGKDFQVVRNARRTPIQTMDVILSVPEHYVLTGTATSELPADHLSEADLRAMRYSQFIQPRMQAYGRRITNVQPNQKLRVDWCCSTKPPAGPET
jgi:hypothetical protein